MHRQYLLGITTTTNKTKLLPTTLTILRLTLLLDHRRLPKSTSTIVNDATGAARIERYESTGIAMKVEVERETAVIMLMNCQKSTESDAMMKTRTSDELSGVGLLGSLLIS